MIREEKAVSTAILIFLVYASFILFEKGAFILPFPLNEYVILFVSLQFLIWNWKENKFQLLLAASAAFFGLVSTQLFWTFFLNDQNMLSLVELPLLDLLKLLYYSLMAIWGSVYLFQSNFIFIKSLAFVFLLILGLAIFYTNYYFEVVGYLIVAITGIVYRISSPIYLLWLLIAVLHLLKLISLNL